MGGLGEHVVRGAVTVAAELAPELTPVVLARRGFFLPGASVLPGMLAVWIIHRHA